MNEDFHWSQMGDQMVVSAAIFSRVYISLSLDAWILHICISIRTSLVVQFFFFFCFNIWWWTLTRINQNKTELGMNLWYFSLAVIHGQVKEYHHVVLLNKICWNTREKERENIALNIRDCSGSAIWICFLRQSYLCYVPTEEGNQSSEKDQDYLPSQIIDRLFCPIQLSNGWQIINLNSWNFSRSLVELTSSFNLHMRWDEKWYAVRIEW